MALVLQLEHVRANIDRACARVGRSSDEVCLLAVSKTQPAAAIRQMYQLGVRDFGENYVQELQRKSSELADLHDLRWHMIGHLQRNKAQVAVRLASWIHSVDSVPLLMRLDKMAQQVERKPSVLIQVNLSGEPQKAGCTVETLAELVTAGKGLSHVCVTGLTLVPAEGEPEATRPFFRQLRELANAYGLTELSMGMSADYEVAVEEGATLVRVGSALFGPRMV